MKRILTILPILSLIVMGCKREPFADASISVNPAYVGEYITFQSYSTNTDYVEWDMGDGFTYDQPVIEHYYVDPGWYDVQLKAFGVKGGVDVAVFPVEVIGSELTVRVWLWTEQGYPNDGYAVPNALVTLYPTLSDWENTTNAVVEGYTNSIGEVTFDGLSYQRYYVDVWEANHDNYTLAGEDVGWIETDPLEGIYLWTFVAYVDYYASKKSTGVGDHPEKTLEAPATGNERTPQGLSTKTPVKRK